MATSVHTPRGTSSRNDEFKPEYGAAEIIALKFTEPKMFTGAYGPRALFTLTDERKMWVDGDDASDICRDLRDKGITRNQPFRFTKIRHARGGGHSFRVEAIAGAAPAWVNTVGTAPASRDASLGTGPSDVEDALTRSLALARTHGAQAFQRGAHIARPAEVPEPAFPQASPETPARTASQQLMSCYLAAIDAISEAQQYCDRKGVKVVFTNEDIRATALSAFIQHERAMLAGRY